MQSISHIFCGDEEGYFCYKTGSKLVEFFNTYFNQNDRYGQGFPSRWAYVYDKLVDMLNKGKFNDFLSLVLSRQYLMRDMDLTEVEAAEHAKKTHDEFNRLVKKDLCTIILINGRYTLQKINDDLVLVGSGGFANVFKQKSTGLIVKKLKDDFLADTGIRSRFKREFNITKSLADLHGIITVYSFDDNNCSYSMEEAESTFENYIKAPGITDDIKINCIRQILYIMTEVHKRDVIHRDLSPNNIFILHGMIKIADFGLGKDLNVFTSHQTLHTNAVGQYYYCAPEQFMLLKDGDKKSDVYSLGRIINFIMTLSPTNSSHIFRSVAEKATNSNAAYRYADAGQLSVYFEKSVEIHKNAENTKEIELKIAQHIFDETVETYIYELSGSKMCSLLLAGKTGLSDSFIQFMKCDNAHAQHLIQNIESNYQEICRSFESYDPFASFAYKVLRNDFSYVVKEIATNILRHIATDVNRFSAQRLVEDLKRLGMEPLLEEILDS